MQRYFTKTKIDNFLIIEESDIHHIKNVMRNNQGDKIECIYDKTLYICKIIDPSSSKVEIIEKLPDDNELSLDVTIAIALVKEQKMDLILQKLTELGINKIIPVTMERSIVKLDQNKFKKKKERWIKICKEAAEQSKRNTIPEIMPLHTIKDLASLTADQKFICSTQNRQNLVNHYLQNLKDYATMIFVIGPEGGITPKEEEVLTSNGYIPITLGNRIMRVETAAIFTASIISFCSNR